MTFKATGRESLPGTADGRNRHHLSPDYWNPRLCRKLAVSRCEFLESLTKPWSIDMFFYMFLTFFYIVQLKPSKKTKTCFNHTFLDLSTRVFRPTNFESVGLFPIRVARTSLTVLDKSSLRYCFSIPVAFTTIELSSLIIPIWDKISVFIKASFGLRGFSDFYNPWF